jgi:hypothetical protein
MKATREQVLAMAKEAGWPEEAGPVECGSLNLEASSIWHSNSRWIS